MHISSYGPYWSIRTSPTIFNKLAILTFEGLADFEQLGNFYNTGVGGTDPVGSSLRAYGITFSTTRALGLVDADALDELEIPLGSGNFANEPSPDTVLYWDFNPGTEDDNPYTHSIDIAGGFTQFVEFFYVANVNPPTVTIRDVSNNVLATTVLTSSATGTGDPFGSTFAIWRRIRLEFAGTGTKLELAGNYGRDLFDNFIFNLVNPAPISLANLYPMVGSNSSAPPSLVSVTLSGQQFTPADVKYYFVQTDGTKTFTASATNLVGASSYKIVRWINGRGTPTVVTDGSIITTPANTFSRPATIFYAVIADTGSAGTNLTVTPGTGSFTYAFDHQAA